MWVVGIEVCGERGGNRGGGEEEVEWILVGRRLAGEGELVGRNGTAAGGGDVGENCAGMFLEVRV